MLTWGGANESLAQEVRLVPWVAMGAGEHGRPVAKGDHPLVCQIRLRRDPHNQRVGGGLTVKAGSPRWRHLKALFFWRCKCPHRKLGGGALRFFRMDRSRGKKRVVTNKTGQREVHIIRKLWPWIDMSDTGQESTLGGYIRHQATARLRGQRGRPAPKNTCTHNFT